MYGVGCVKHRRNVLLQNVQDLRGFYATTHCEWKERIIYVVLRVDCFSASRTF